MNSVLVRADGAILHIETFVTFDNLEPSPISRLITDLPSRHFVPKDVVLTSMRRDDVASTLIRRHFGTKCPLGQISSESHECSDISL